MLNQFVLNKCVESSHTYLNQGTMQYHDDLKGLMMTVDAVDDLDSSYSYETGIRSGGL